jgi:hypothetical protein
MYEVDGRGRVDREMRMLRDAMLETLGGRRLRSFRGRMSELRHSSYSSRTCSREERDSQRSSFSLILDGALMLVR